MLTLKTVRNIPLKIIFMVVAVGLFSHGCQCHSDKKSAASSPAKTPSSSDPVACFSPGPNPSTEAKKLDVINVKDGTGAEAQEGDQVSVHYTGYLANCKSFDSSRTRGEPFDFTIGKGQVIKGWEAGVVGMKVGGHRHLVISPELAYGPQGAGNVIPPNATLLFEIELLDVKKSQAVK